MIKRIVMLGDEVLDERNFRRFGLGLLQDGGFKVEYWDTAPSLFKMAFNARDGRKAESAYEKYVRTFFRKNELFGAIKDLKEDTIVVVTISKKIMGLYIALTASKAEYVVITAGAMPDIRDADAKRHSAAAVMRKALKVLRSSPYEIWKNMIEPRLPYSWFDIKPARFLLAGGSKSLKYDYPTGKKTQILWAHTFDYDIYLEEKERPEALFQTAVFLDSYLPFHPDWAYVGMDPDIDAGNYYRRLNDFFDKVEKQSGLEVVIAAHPRSDYDNMPSLFGRRKCIKDDSIRLVRDSKLVMVHGSTAVNFANLFFKPILFLSTSEMDRLGIGPTIRMLAELHGKKTIDIDNGGSIDWRSVFDVDRMSYKRYRDAYIKADSSAEEPFWQILADNVKKIA